MPKNTTILIVRHGEKPDTDDDVNLSPPGHARSHAYVAFFKHLLLDNNRPAKISHVMAAADSKASHRPRLTVTQVADNNNLKVKTDYSDEQFEQQAKHILEDSKYDNQDILICWHHGKLLKLTEALGVDSTKLPASANWPMGKWPEDVFGWLIKVVYDDKGNVDYTKTECLPQNLMYDDNGQFPPSEMITKETATVSPDGQTTTTDSVTTKP